MPRRLTRKRPRPSREPLLTGVGESGLLHRLATLLPGKPRWVLAGAGADDAAVVDVGAGELWLLSCDVQCEGTHFERRWLDAYALGRRAAAVNLSDIAAMGGAARLALVSLLLPPRLPASFFDGVMRGLADRFRAAGTTIVGGNIARSECLAVDVTVAGRVRREDLLRRSGARPGDLVAVTGSPGDSAAGLAHLQRGAGRRGALVQRFLAPEPRLQAGAALAALGATAAIDVSDGISTDVLHLCDASGVDVEMHWEALPVSAALARAGRNLRTDPRHWVLHGGESYELLCTLPAARFESVRRGRLALPGFPLHAIGTILPPGSGRWLVRAGERLPLVPASFEHFAAAKAVPSRRPARDWRADVAPADSRRPRRPQRRQRAHPRRRPRPRPRRS